MPTKYRQTVTVTLTSTNDDPLGDLYDALDTFDYTIDEEGVVEEIPGINRDRLVALTVWAAGEDAKKRLGLPSEWDQWDWLRRSDRAGNACGTACCIAGKVALEDGGIPVYEQYRGSRQGVVAVPWDQMAPGARADYVLFPGQATPVEPSVYARKVLGLNSAQACMLFSGDNRLADIIRVVGDLLKQDEEEAAPTPVPAPPSPPTSRPRPRRRLRVPEEERCSIGEECNMCYEDVPDGEDDVTF